MNLIWCRKKDCRFFSEGPNPRYEYGNCKLAEIVINTERVCEQYEKVGEYVSV